MISKITKGGYFKGLMNYLTREEAKHQMLGNSMASDSAQEQVEIMVVTAG